MEQLGSHWTDFHEIWHLSIFRKSVEKIKVSLKSHMNNGYFTWRPIYTYDHISILLRMRNFSEICCRKNQNTHFRFSNSFSNNSAVYEIMWKHMAVPNRPQMTVWLMHFACWINKAAYTHSKYVILTAFPRQQWSHEHASMLCLYIHCLSCSTWVQL